MNHGLKAQSTSICLVLLLALSLPRATAAQAATAGEFIFVQGKVWVIRDDNDKELGQKGDVVAEGDTILSSKKGYAQLLMRDGGYVAIRPDTRLHIEAFQYYGCEDSSERSVLSLFKGSFRAVTGAIGRTHKQAYQIKTPVAIIGIRGTDHEPMFIPAPLEGEIPTANPGVYDRVNVGQTYIENEAGRVFINANQVGYTPDALTQPVTLAEIPAFYKEVPTPKDAEKQDGATNSEQDQDVKNGLEDEIFLDAIGPVAELTNIYKPIIPRNSPPIDLGSSTVQVPAYRVVGFAAWDPRSSTAPHTVVEGRSNTLDRVDTDASDHIVGFDGNLPVIGGGYEEREPVRLEIGSASLVDAGSDPATGISWGRWSGGGITATNLETGSAVSPAFNPADLHTISGPELTNPIVLPITGTYVYSLVGGTHPTDQLGNVGVLNGASLTAHFDHMTVDAGVNVTVGMVTLDASATSIPILNASSSFSLNRTGPSFAAGMNEPTPLNINCSGPGCGATHNGILSGGFVGPGGNAAAMAYSLNTTDGSTIDTTISGVAAFKRE